ncbi:MAG: carbamoyltransferase HypF [Myxococcota bacterium]
MTAAVRFRLSFEGLVQGVGFRPLVARLAQAQGLGGEVYNLGARVRLELEGPPGFLPAFLEQLEQQLPPLGSRRVPTVEPMQVQDQRSFLILPSQMESGGLPQSLPDLAPCPACLDEVLSPTGRRSGYVFTSCTRCGPRDSIQKAPPWDRERTSMVDFPLCAACLKEYTQPSDRRFHAQTLACPACGPQLEGHLPGGERVGHGEQAFQQALEYLRRGQVVAMLGVGGFQLLVDARSEEAVMTLRQRKHRPHKPLAVLVAGLEQAERLARLSPLERQLLESPAAPIVLVRSEETLAKRVNMHLPWLGMMLPASPLHALLVRDFGGPLVVTSGNRAGEPLCLTLSEALEALGEVADFFLSHNRPLLRPLDDSVVQVVLGASGSEQAQWLRRGRGASPWTMEVPASVWGGCGTQKSSVEGNLDAMRMAQRGMLALGGQLKAAPAVLSGDGVAAPLLQLGPHVGELSTEKALQRHLEGARELLERHGVNDPVVLEDAHPEAATAATVKGLGTTSRRCGHHEAHARAAMLEAQCSEALALVLDGAGYGLDGTLWGGELLQVTRADCVRRGQLRPYYLVGGALAFRQPWRCLLGVWGMEARREQLPAWVRARLPAQAEALEKLGQQPAHRLETSSAGRLFDAVAALLGFEGTQTYEGHAALWLEGLATQALERSRPSEGGSEERWVLPRVLERGHGGLWLDPFPVMQGMAQVLEQINYSKTLTSDCQISAEVGRLALHFHQALAQGLVWLVEKAQETEAKKLPVLLTGGCFQNRLLLAFTRQGLEQRGWRVQVPQQVPLNDGGLAVGQLMAALHGRALG